jgi:hypothetical protein
MEEMISPQILLINIYVTKMRNMDESLPQILLVRKTNNVLSFSIYMIRNKFIILGFYLNNIFERYIINMNCTVKSMLEFLIFFIQYEQMVL